MLKITSIKINGLEKGLITDSPPNIVFTIESDVQGDALKKGTIKIGAWEKETTDQLNNTYTGEMKAFTKYPVQIEVESKSGQVATAIAEFESGRKGTPWIGKWITDKSYHFPDKKSPKPMNFRRYFNTNKAIKRAFMNATALGIYEITLNGEKVGEDYFAPGLTSYRKQIQYQTYDLTGKVQKENEILITVAGGWAVGSFTYRRVSKIDADRQAFLSEIHLE